MEWGGMFGYRLVHKDVYALMLAALERSQVGPVTDAPALATPVRAPSPEASAPAPAVSLPPDVIGACEFYAFGDREEEARNFRRAQDLWMKQTPEAKIIDVIQRGANVDGLFL